MRLGGYVLHRNNRETLGAALSGLLAVCDEVVAVDSESTDGSVELARGLGARSVTRPWQGYGAARAAAVRELAGCDWVLFVDSDEQLAPESLEVLRAWRTGPHEVPAYLLPVRDWAELPGRRFHYRTGWRKRLVRREAAGWRPEMIVHETPGNLPTRRLWAPIEHRFATSVERRSEKEERYALLWALKAQAEHRRLKPAFLQRPAHVVRDCLVHGALWRGGMDALRLAWAVSSYHAAKYRYLRALRRGEHRELVAAFQEGRYGEVFDRVREGRL